MMNQADPFSAPTGKFVFRANYLCLDFTNTIAWRGTDEPMEGLQEYTDLLVWCVNAEFLDVREARELDHRADLQSDLAQRVLEESIELRESLYRVFRCVHRKQDSDPKDLDHINDHLMQTLPHRRLVAQGPGFTAEWESSTDLHRPIWPVVLSAFELLGSNDLDRIHQCSDDLCGWLFFDTSRNRSRRWCDMKDCGNRAKARRFYERSRNRAPT